MLKWFKRRLRPQPAAMLPIVPMARQPLPDPVQEVLHRAMAFNRAAKETNGDIYTCGKTMGELFKACEVLAEHWYQQLYPVDEAKVSAAMEAELPQRHDLRPAGGRPRPKGWEPRPHPPAPVLP